MLDPTIWSQVRRLEIRMRRSVADAMAGGYASVFRGSGIEFDEVREYVPGDDVRRIDGNVTARAGRPFVKKFVEERELTVVFLVDRSPSMAFGSGARTKREVAVEFAALLAFAAIRHHDKVGLVAFDGDRRTFVPIRKGFRHALRAVGELATAAPPDGRPDRDVLGVAGVLEFAGRVLRRRAIVFLVSDFLEEGYERALSVVARRHDLVAARVVDPREEMLPPLGPIFLEDAETGEHGWLDPSLPEVREAYAARARARRETFERATSFARTDAIELRTDAPVLDPVLEFFRRRRRRGARE